LLPAAACASSTASHASEVYIPFAKRWVVLALFSVSSGLSALIWIQLVSVYKVAQEVFSGKRCLPDAIDCTSTRVAAIP
jgi:hypothetical protein